MKSFTFITAIFLSGFVFSQQSEDLVPKQAVSVLTINNVSLLQKISLDELVKYEFMEEVQQELFDGSTANKTLKESGIDFDQKMNFFFGNNAHFEVSGFTFGVKNKEQLFEVFDDFLPAKSEYPGIEFYESYFNRIAIKGNTGILFRVSPNMDAVNDLTDSLWMARGNEYPWDFDYPEMEELMDALDAIDTTSVDAEALEFFPEMEIEENTPTPTLPLELPVADEDPTEKTYYELRDSVELSMQQEVFSQVCNELFIQGGNLKNSSHEFEQKLLSESEAVFYFDNSRSQHRKGKHSIFRTGFPSFYSHVEELYTGNIMTGDLLMNDQSIELKLDAKYGQELGSIYTSMTDTKFDKNVAKYIKNDNSSFFTYRVNMREAYEQTYKVLAPILENEESKDYGYALLIWELYDEFLNKDALFNTYKGSVFGTFNGIARVKTTKYEFEYDEETFEYIDREVEAEEDMPLFTLGFSTARLDIADRFLNRLSRLEESLHNEGDYWVIERAILNAAPLYLILKNDLFILTNNIDLAENHADGYASNSINKAQLKKAKKSGVLYAYADLGKAIEDIPRELFDDRRNEVIDVIRGKTGKIELSSSKTSSESTSFNLTYSFEGSQESSTAYILDLINSLYVITK